MSDETVIEASYLCAIRAGEIICGGRLSQVNTSSQALLPTLVRAARCESVALQKQ
jgi:hypothetical protein